MKIIRILAVVCLFSALSYAQCPQGSALNIGTCADPVTNIVITPAVPVVVVGQTLTLTATFQLQSGKLSTLANSQVSWSSSDNTLATFASGDPVVSGVAAGSVVITATSNADSGITGTVTLIVAASPAITNPNAATCVVPCVLPNATNGLAYPPYTFAALGGTLPYAWTNSVGSPPAGISLSGGGVLSGTHNAIDTSTWTVQVCDALASCTTLQVSLTTLAGASCGTPPNYCARTDTAVASGSTVNSGKPPAALMGLNGAGSSVFDDLNSGPAANHITRVTDYAMVQANLNAPATNYFSVDSSSTQRATNCGSLCSASNVFSGTTNGKTAFFSYTAPTTAALLGVAAHDSGASNGVLFGAPEFSTTNPLLFYSGGGANGGQLRATLNSYLQDGTVGAGSWGTSHITATTLLDPINCPGLSTYNTGPLGGTWNKYLAMQISDVSTSTGANPVVAGDYRYLQDQSSLIIVYDPSVGGNHCRWLDIRSGQRGGDDMSTVSTTGFGPLPAPAAPTVSIGTDFAGNLTCNHSYAVRITYTLVGGSNTFGGESLPSPIVLSSGSGSSSTCYISVNAPIANPGGGTGINLTLTATGFNVYACDRTAVPGCTPVLQTNGTNSSGTLTQPSISSVTGCAAGSSTYTFYLIAKNAGGTSVPSTGFTVTNVKDFALAGINCKVNWSAIPNASNYDLTVDGFNVFAGSSTGTSFTVNLGEGINTSNYVIQSVPIATSVARIGFAATGPLTTSTIVVPTLNTAGPMFHNLRIDETGQWMVISDSVAFSILQPNPAKGPPTWLWHIPTSTLIPCAHGIQTAPYTSYCQAHWTHGNGTMLASLVGSGIPGQTAATSVITFNDSVATMNSTASIIGSPNGNLDTQSGDSHYSGNYIAGPVFRDGYPLASPYVLPTVPYNGEIVAVDKTTPNKIWRFCHTWDSGAQGFFSTPRGNVSQDGTYMDFASDMQRNSGGLQGTAAVGLGSFSGGSTCTPGLTSPSANACRYDIYICEIK